MEKNINSDQRHSQINLGMVLKNRMLCVDVTTFLNEDAVMKYGKYYPGLLVQDDEDNLSFVENLPKSKERTKVKRNPVIDQTDSFNVHQADDGGKYLTTVRTKFYDNDEFSSHCLHAGLELLHLSGLVKKGDHK